MHEAHEHRCRARRVADAVALVLQGRAGHLPALAPLAHDPVLGRLRVGEENLVEVGASGHLFERTHFDAGLIHRNQEVRDTRMLRLVRLRAAEAEHEISFDGRRRPDLLTVDDPLITDQLGAGLERGEIAARARLAVPLAPLVFAAQRLRNEFLLLPLFPLLEQCGDEHHRTDSSRVEGRAQIAKLLGDHARLLRVRGLLGAAVLLRNAAQQVAALHRLLAKGVPSRLVGTPTVGALRTPVFSEEVLHFLAKGLVLRAVAEIHERNSPEANCCGRSAAAVLHFVVILVVVRAGIVIVSEPVFAPVALDEVALGGFPPGQMSVAERQHLEGLRARLPHVLDLVDRRGLAGAIGASIAVHENGSLHSSVQIQKIS